MDDSQLHPLEFGIAEALVNSVREALSRVCRDCGLSRGVCPDEFLDIQDFGRRLGIGRDQRNHIRDCMIRNGIGVANGRSRAALGREFIEVMRIMAPKQHSER